MVDLLMQTDRRYAAAMARARRARHEALRAAARGLIRLPVRGVRALASRWRRHRLVAELRALNDLVLADIGLYRGDIRSTVDAVLRQEHSRGRTAGHAGDDRPLPPEPAWTPRPACVAPNPDPARNDNATGTAYAAPSPAWEKQAS